MCDSASGMTSPNALKSPKSTAASLSTSGTGSGGRLEQLDSVRGIAAATVVLSHVVQTFPAMQPGGDSLIGKLAHTPLHILWAGTEAVNLFFILSGFVLALPFLKGEQPYGRYALKRIARIWIPYIAVVITALIAKTLVGNQPIPSLSKWFNAIWAGDISTYDLVGHVLLIPPFKNDQIVPVIWSLVHEMRISLIFPFLMVFVTRSKTSTVIAASIFLYALGLGLALVASKRPIIPQDIALSVMFSSLFLTGALLSKHRKGITERAQGLTTAGRWSLLVCAAILYTFPHWGVFLPDVIEIATRVAISSMGSAIFIVIALASGRVSNLLTTKPLLILGWTSYSLYLVHTLVLTVSLRLIGPQIGYELAALAALFFMVPATWICYQLFEKPAISLSRSIGRKSTSA